MKQSVRYRMSQNALVAFKKEREASVKEKNWTNYSIHTVRNYKLSTCNFSF
jgi:hypothetical protein